MTCFLFKADYPTRDHQIFNYIKNVSIFIFFDFFQNYAI